MQKDKNNSEEEEEEEEEDQVSQYQIHQFGRSTARQSRTPMLAISTDRSSTKLLAVLTLPVCSVLFYYVKFQRFLDSSTVTTDGQATGGSLRYAATLELEAVR